MDSTNKKCMFDETAFNDYARRIIKIKKFSTAQKLALEIYKEGAR